MPRGIVNFSFDRGRRWLISGREGNLEPRVSQVLTAPDFARLAARVAEARDRAAFAVLFDHFVPRLESYLVRLGLNRSAAEEITQEVMVVLWQKAALFDPSKSSLATWLFRIARNRRIDAARRDSSRTLEPGAMPLIPDEPESPDALIDQQVRDERVRAAMKTLPEEQVALLRLAFFLGRSHSEISEETGLPLGTVKSRIRLAFGRLRKILETDPKIAIDDD